MQNSDPKLPELDNLAVYFCSKTSNKIRREKKADIIKTVITHFIWFSILATLILSSWLVPSGWEIYFSQFVSQFVVILRCITTMIHTYLLCNVDYFDLGVIDESAAVSLSFLHCLFCVWATQCANLFSSITVTSCDSPQWHWKLSNLLSLPHNAEVRRPDQLKKSLLVFFFKYESKIFLTSLGMCSIFR